MLPNTRLEPARRIWFWIAPGITLGAAVLGAIFSDWLNMRAANTGDVTAEVVLWGVVAQALTGSIASIVLVLLEGPVVTSFRMHVRHSALLYIVCALLLIELPEWGHMGHWLGYLTAQAAAAILANAGVLAIVRLMAGRGVGRREPGRVVARDQKEA